LSIPRYLAQVVAHRVLPWEEVVDDPMTAVVYAGPFDTEEAADAALDVYLPATYQAITQWTADMAGGTDFGIVTTSGDIQVDHQDPDDSDDDLLPPSTDSDGVLRVVDTLLSKFQQNFARRATEILREAPGE
jgi:hypothetical protein